MFDFLFFVYINYMNRRDLFKDINNYLNFKVKLRGFYVVKE